MVCPLPIEEDFREQWKTLTAELRQAHQDLALAAIAHASDPDPGGVAELRMVQALEKRNEAASRVGVLLLRWETRGGSFDLVDPRPRVAPVKEVKEAPKAPEVPPERQTARIVSLPPPASEKDLEKLVGWSKGEGKPTRKAQVLRETKSVLESVLEMLGSPVKVTKLEGYNSEMGLLQRVVDTMDTWVSFPRDAQRSLIGAIAARARHLQDEVAPKLDHPFASVHLDGIFSTLTQFSAVYRPGFVLGLSRSHTPNGSSWVEDAKDYWYDLTGDEEPETPAVKTNPDKAIHELESLALEDDVERQDLVEATLRCLEAQVPANDPRLSRLLAPHIKLLTKEPKLKAVRKAIRNYQKQIHEEAKETVSPIPDDWPYWDQVRGKNVAIVGGDKPLKVTRLKEAFEFDFEWIAGWKMRQIEAMASRAERGTVDMVILLTAFLSHKAWDHLTPACKAGGTPLIIVERGYGVNQVRQAMERTFGGDGGADGGEEE